MPSGSAGRSTTSARSRSTQACSASPAPSPTRSWRRSARTLALTHHERWDGTGYPHGLAGEDIPVEARLLGVADAFDAMTSERSYRPALSVEQALAELKRCAGSQFDPELAETFVDGWRRGEIAVTEAPIGVAI